MTALLGALLWQPAALAAVAAIVNHRLRRQPAALRHQVFVAALLLASALPFATVGLHLQTGWLKPAATPVAIANAARVASPAAPVRVPVAALQATDAAAAPAAAPAAPPRGGWPWRAAAPELIAAWFLLAALWHLAAIVRRWRRTQLLCRAGRFLRLCAGVPVLRTSAPSSPFTAGVFHPVIVVPDRLLDAGDPAWLEAALAHELAHIQRRDYPWALACELAVAPLAFHPAAHWLLRRIAETREMACDETANALVPGYAGALVAIAAQVAAGYPLVGLCLARLSHFERRIQALTVTPHRRSRVALSAGFCALGAASLSAWAAGGGLRPAAPRAHAMEARLFLSGALPTVVVTPPPAAQAVPRAGAAPAQELSAAEQKWLNEDVAYIITDPERDVFLHLANETLRRQFIEAFWQRRNPDPGSTYNAFEEEHYRRIAFANGHFAASGLAGWKSDRGRIYITWGPANEVHTHDGSPDLVPYEEWVYTRIDGVGTNVRLEFDDPCRCGVYQFATHSPQAMDAQASQNSVMPVAQGPAASSPCPISESKSAEEPPNLPSAGPVRFIPKTVDGKTVSAMLTRWPDGSFWLIGDLSVEAAYGCVAQVAGYAVQFDARLDGNARLTLDFRGYTVAEALSSIATASHSAWKMLDAKTVQVGPAPEPEAPESPMYLWNGRVLNAYDYFNKAQPGAPVPAQSSTVLVGCLEAGPYRIAVSASSGPLLHNKIFYFYDADGTEAPSPAATQANAPPTAWALIPGAPDLNLDALVGQVVAATGTAVPAPDQASAALAQRAFRVTAVTKVAAACPAGQ